MPIDLPDDVVAGSVTNPDHTVAIASYDPVGNVIQLQAPLDQEVLNQAALNDLPGPKFLSRHEFGDTKHRTVQYQLIATTRFREYFPHEVTDHPEQLQVAGASAKVEVPSSARPPGPKVLYAVPMFEWTRTTASDGSQSRVRAGGGVRVYLERPWFSSGDGKLLASS